MSNTAKRIVILISSNGSNLQAIIDAVNNKQIAGQIVSVISNTPTAYGLQRAELAGINTLSLDHTKFSDREQFDQELIYLIDQLNSDLIVLAGYLRILSPRFVKHYTGRLLNIHPSLLPKYPGLNTHSRVLQDGGIEHGASIHFVTDDLDGGPLIMQVRIKIKSNENEQSLANKVLQQEHKIYPLVVKWFCQQRLQLVGEFAKLDNQTLEQPLEYDPECGKISYQGNEFQE